MSTDLVVPKFCKLCGNKFDPAKPIKFCNKCGWKVVLVPKKPAATATATPAPATLATPIQTDDANDTNTLINVAPVVAPSLPSLPPPPLPSAPLPAARSNVPTIPQTPTPTPIVGTPAPLHAAIFDEQDIVRVEFRAESPEPDIDTKMMSFTGAPSMADDLSDDELPHGTHDSTNLQRGDSDNGGNSASSAPDDSVLAAVYAADGDHGDSSGDDDDDDTDGHERAPDGTYVLPSFHTDPTSPSAINNTRGSAVYELAPLSPSTGHDDGSIVSGVNVFDFEGQFASIPDFLRVSSTVVPTTIDSHTPAVIAAATSLSPTAESPPDSPSHLVAAVAATSDVHAFDFTAPSDPDASSTTPPTTQSEAVTTTPVMTTPAEPTSVATTPDPTPAPAPAAAPVATVVEPIPTPPVVVDTPVVATPVVAVAPVETTPPVPVVVVATPVPVAVVEPTPVVATPTPTPAPTPVEATPSTSEATVTGATNAAPSLPSSKPKPKLPISKPKTLGAPLAVGGTATRPPTAAHIAIADDTTPVGTTISPSVTVQPQPPLPATPTPVVSSSSSEPGATLTVAPAASSATALTVTTETKAADSNNGGTSRGSVVMPKGVAPGAFSYLGLLQGASQSSSATSGATTSTSAPSMPTSSPPSVPTATASASADGSPPNYSAPSPMMQSSGMVSRESTTVIEFDPRRSISPSFAATWSGPLAPGGQATASGTSGAPAPAAVATPAHPHAGSAYYQIVQEILNTEFRFVDSLKVLCEVFILPCQKFNQQSSRTELGRIAADPRVAVFFSITLQIYTLNSKMYQDIKERVANWTPETVLGDIFLHYAPLFKIFSQYAKDHEPVSHILLSQAARPGEFKNFVDKCHADPRLKGQTIESFLITPVQRVPRYILLLTELRKRTPAGTKALEMLEAGMKQVGVAAMHVNETIRERENKDKLRKIEAKFTSTIELVNPTGTQRVLLREGSLQRKTRSGFTTYYFHLFTDLLLYSEDTLKGYKLHRRLDFASGCAASDVKDSEKEQFAFQFNSAQKSFVVCAKSAAEKKEWLDAITSSLQKFAERSQMAGKAAAPVWTQDREHKACSLCKLDFSFLNRRHHCRMCGALVCATCSTGRRLLTNIDQKSPVRLCDPCMNNDGSEANLAAAAAARNSANGVTTNGDSKTPANGDDTTSASNGDPASPTASTPATNGEHKASSPSTTSSPSASNGTPGIPADLLYMPDPATHPGDARYAAACDIAATEVEFCNHMRVLLEGLVQPLLGSMMVGTKAQTKTTLRGRNVSSHLAVFLNNLEPIYNLNLELLKQVRAAIQDWNAHATEPAFGELFKRYAPLFELYRQYSRSHQQGLRILGETFPEYIKKFEEDMQIRLKTQVTDNMKRALGSAASAVVATTSSDGTAANPATGAPLSSKNLLSLQCATVNEFCMLPVMRVTKYVWLLGCLIRATPESHADHSLLNEALQNVQRALNDINTAVVEGDNIDKLTLIQARFVDGHKLIDFVDANRKLVREGPLKRLTRSGVIKYYFHLFNDLLLYSEGEAGSKAFKLHRRIELLTTLVTDRPHTADEPHAIQVNSAQKSFVVCCHDMDDKNKWLAALKKCIADCQKANEGKMATGNIAPVWVQNHAATNCPLCKKKFNMINRRHHCRSCGGLVCGDCSKARLVLANISEKKPVRVCINCHASLTNTPLPTPPRASVIATGGPTSPSGSSGNNTASAASLVAAAATTPASPSSSSSSSSSTTTPASPSSETKSPSDATTTSSVAVPVVPLTKEQKKEAEAKAKADAKAEKEAAAAAKKEAENKQKAELKAKKEEAEAKAKAAKLAAEEAKKLAKLQAIQAKEAEKAAKKAPPPGAPPASATASATPTPAATPAIAAAVATPTPASPSPSASASAAPAAVATPVSAPSTTAPAS